MGTDDWNGGGGEYGIVGISYSSSNPATGTQRNNRDGNIWGDGVRTRRIRNQHRAQAFRRRNETQRRIKLIDNLGNTRHITRDGKMATINDVEGLSTPPAGSTATQSTQPRIEMGAYFTLGRIT